MPTVREQLDSVWNFISGAGVDVDGNVVGVWRDGSWHRFSTFIPVDEIGHFRYMEAVWLYATQAVVLTRKELTVNLFRGWNNIGWMVDEEAPPADPAFVWITHIGVNPSRVRRGELLTITGIITVTRAFTGRATVCLLEPPGHTTSGSSASTTTMIWSIGAHSFSFPITVNSLNALGNNRVRVLILDGAGNTLARNDSQFVDVIEQEEHLPAPRVFTIGSPTASVV